VAYLCKDCPFSAETRILTWANLSFLSDISSLGSLYDWWKRLRSRCCKESKKIFDGLFICFWWNIWLERNNRIFKGQQRSTVKVAQLVKDQVGSLLTPFRSVKHSTRTVAVPSAQGRTVRARGQTVRGLVRGAVVLSGQGRTVRGLGPDGPRPGAGARVPCLTAGRSAPWGRTVRAYAGVAEDHRRRLDLAPGRDPVGE
jgi:hypothetical protein